MTSVLAPVVFDAPLVNPAPGGLFTATQWTEEAGSPRWLSGMQFRKRNYGGASGVWPVDWCATADEIDAAGAAKTGDRPADLDPFDPITVWAPDECDPSPLSRAEVHDRATQNLRLKEQVEVEREFAGRLMLDGGPLVEQAENIAQAVTVLERALARTNTVGFIHASADLLVAAETWRIVVRSGNTLRTPGGHVWVFGAGYIDVLGTTLVATSQPYGWRTAPVTRDAINPTRNRFSAIAERSFLIGYEEVVGAASAGALPPVLGISLEIGQQGVAPGSTQPVTVRAKRG